ncbi:MAG: hypothetical protein M3198_03780 [Actinomycetota bacterium]|nr:hypothetical protein [Actinomycetota bacterium]
MTTRFCTRCDNEVEDAGGYCLLGHRLALEPLSASLSDLRKEIDDAFESARIEVAAVVSGTEITQPMRIQAAAPPPPPPRGAVAAPPRPRRAGPPPPPPPRRAPRTAQVTPQEVQVAAPVDAVVEQRIQVPPSVEPRVERHLETPVAQPVVEEPVQPVPPPPPPEPHRGAFDAPFSDDDDVALALEAEALLEPSPDLPNKQQILERKYPVWHDLEEASPLVGDPIGAFAPPPQMDWGPEKSVKILKRKPSRHIRRSRED